MAVSEPAVLLDVEAPPSDSDSAAVLLNVEEAARCLGIGRTTMYALISGGSVETVTIGRRRLVPPESLANFVAALRSSNQPEAAAA
jgi:excisionase family DNA binding protein